jgi:tetratricopeptide (TPR) repeat protein
MASSTLPGESGFFAGYEKARIGRHADAIELYLEVAKIDPDLAPYAKIRAARSRARAGDVPGAIRELEGVLRDHPAGPWTRWAHHEIAEWHYKEGSYGEASPHYAKAVESEVSLWWIDDVRLKQAKNDLVVSGRKRDALGYFREVLETTRWYDKRVLAARNLAKSDVADDRIRAALGLLRSGKYGEAGRIASSIPGTWLKEPHLEREWRRLSARLLIARGRKTEGRKQLEALALEYPKESWADKALLYTAISLIGAEKWDEADRVVRQLMRSYPDSESTLEGMMRIARAHARYDHTDRAVEWYRQRVKLYGDDEDTGAALVEAGHAYREAKRDQEAIGMYDQLLNDYPKDDHAAEAGFRAGQLLQKNGQSKLAKARYEKAVASGLTRYYGYRAREILVTDFGLSESEAPDLGVTGTMSFVRPILQGGKGPDFALERLKEDVRFERLRFFAHNGFLEAEWESLGLTQAIGSHADPELLYRGIGEAGTSYSAMQWADEQDFGVNADGSQTIERLRIRYPRPYWEYVTALGEELELDPYLILAIARQESTFRPGLKSSAGAQGVMQLMPRTAKWLGDTDRAVSRNTAQRLDEPRHSLRMGAVYFRRMLDRSEGNLVYALVSYNAGPGNFDKWRRRNPNLSLAEFVEEIPFGETRNYVKRILAHYATYKSIYPE